MEKLEFKLLIYVLLVIAPIEYSVGNENTVFLYNHIESCKSTEYYDVNYFLCRECDPQLYLIPSEDGENIVLVNCSYK